MGNILDQTVPGMYDTNVATNPKYNGRVEFAVRIPAADGSGHAWLPIDSKFPMEDYARLTAAAQAGDQQGMESDQKALQQQGILLAGPTTVTALLNALAMGFRTLAINRKATEVWQVLGAAKMQYEKFGDLLQKARKKVDEAGKVLDEADHRNHIIQKHLRRVETLDDPTAAEAVPELFD